MLNNYSGMEGNLPQLQLLNGLYLEVKNVLNSEMALTSLRQITAVLHHKYFRR